MKLFITVFSFFTFTSIQAIEFKHQVIFGSSIGFLGYGGKSSAQTDTSLGIEDFSIASNNFALNYFHTITKKEQIGLLIERKISNTDISMKSNARIKSYETKDSIYFIVSLRQRSSTINFLV